MSIEAMKLALEKVRAAQQCHPNAVMQLLCEADEALKEALAKQEQGEPHSWYSAQEDEWMTDKTRKDHERLNSYTHKVGGFDLPLYTTLQQRKPLTDEEANELWESTDSDWELMKRVEAKLKEKNT